MKCEIHGGDIGDIRIPLPIRSKKGALDTLACLRCAEQSRAYCLEHSVPHVHWGSQWTCCMLCARELTEKTKWRVGAILLSVRKAAPEDFRILAEEKRSVFLTTEQSNWSLLYFFVASALALKIDIDDLVRRIEKDGSMDFLKNEPRTFV